MFSNNYLKGDFMPKHPEKCLNYNGKVEGHPVTFRSSYEKIMANWLDLNNNILEWGSEIVEIPYYSQIDGKTHKYITDFMFTCKNKQGKIEKWLGKDIIFILRKFFGVILLALAVKLFASNLTIVIAELAK